MELCSFCNRSADQVERLIAGPPDVYICNECIELCNSILQREAPQRGHNPLKLKRVPTPHELKTDLDAHVISQERGKRVLSVAVHNHYQRILNRERIRSESLAIPRIRDFRGFSPASFDGRGNYTLGIAEQVVFPEVDIDKVEFVQGMDITLCVSGGSDEGSRELLRLLGFPFRREEAQVQQRARA